jgi:hypothetical protein
MSHPTQCATGPGPGNFRACVQPEASACLTRGASSSFFGNGGRRGERISERTRVTVGDVLTGRLAIMLMSLPLDALMPGPSSGCQRTTEATPAGEA